MQTSSAIFRDTPSAIFWGCLAFAAFAWAAFVLLKSHFLNGLAVRRPKQKIRLMDLRRMDADPRTKERLRRIESVQFIYTWQIGLAAVLLSVALLWLGLSYAFDSVAVSDGGFVIKERVFFSQISINYDTVCEVRIRYDWQMDRRGAWHRYTKYMFVLLDGQQRIIPIDSFLGKSLEKIQQDLAARKVPVIGPS